MLEDLRAGDYSLGGEQSGHIVLPAYATTGDGVLTGLQLMDRMVATGHSLAELASVVTVLPQVLINVAVSDRDAGGKKVLQVGFVCFCLRLVDAPNITTCRGRLACGVEPRLNLVF